MMFAPLARQETQGAMPRCSELSMRLKQKIAISQVRQLMEYLIQIVHNQVKHHWNLMWEKGILGIPQDGEVSQLLLK